MEAPCFQNDETSQMAETEDSDETAATQDFSGIRIEAVWTQDENSMLPYRGLFENQRLDTSSTSTTVCPDVKLEPPDDQYCCKTYFMRSNGASPDPKLLFATECCDSCSPDSDLAIDREYDPFVVETTPRSIPDTHPARSTSTFQVKTEPVDYEEPDVKPDITTLNVNVEVEPVSSYSQQESVRRTTHSDAAKIYIQHEGKLLKITPCFVNIGPNLKLPAQCYARSKRRIDSLEFFEETTDQQESKEPIKVKIYICSNCGVKSTDSTQHSQHTADCRNPINRTSSKATETVLYPCRMCSFKFRNKYNLTMHEKKHKAGEGHKCNMCDVVCPSPDELMSHVRQHHQAMRHRAQFSCNVCPYVSNNIHHFKEHNARHTVDRYLFCCKCRRNYESKKEFAKHQSKINGWCNASKKCIRRLPLVNTDEGQATPKSTFDCKPSSLVESRKENIPTKIIDNSIILNNPSGSSQVNGSIGGPTVTDNPKKWKLKPPDKNMFECKKCEYTCLELKSFIAHDMTEHNDNSEVFTCRLCLEKIQKCDNYIEHMKKAHPGNACFSCPYCMHDSTRKDHFLTHLSKVHKSKGCSKCTYKTQYIQSLKFHLKSHDAVNRPYSCTTCPYSTQVSKHLIKHYKKYHSDQVPGTMLPGCKPPLKRFACSKCPFRSNRSYDLRKHWLRHLRHEKNNTQYKYKSRIKISVDENQVDETKASHTVSAVSSHLLNQTLNKVTETPKEENNNKCRWYICSKCDYKSLYRSCLYRHLKRIHNTLGGVRNRIILKKEQKSGETVHKGLKPKVVRKGKLFSCLKCGLKSKFKASIQRHIKRIHSSKQENSKENIKSSIVKVEDTEKSQDNKSPCLQKENNTWYYCSMCDFKSCKIKTVYNHLYCKHNTSGGVRDSKILRTKPMKIPEMKTKDSNRLFSCDSCKYTTKWKSCMTQHKKKYHKAVPEAKSSESHETSLDFYKCSKCDYTAKSIKSVYRHCFRVHQVRGGVRNKIILKFSLNRNQFQKTIQVENCTREDNSREHSKVTTASTKTQESKEIAKQKVGKKVKLRECPDCDIKSQPISTQKLHAKLGHEEFWDRRFACKYCGMRFCDKAKLSRHISKHTQRNLVCNICKVYRTYRKDILHSHSIKCNVVRAEQEQGTEEDLQCDSCSLTFQDVTEYTMHIASHILEECGIADD